MKSPIFNVVFFLVGALFVSANIEAQEPAPLVQFNNGEIADATAVNNNFNNHEQRIQVLEQYQGCSAQQDGSQVIIECADGSSGILVSQGKVLVVEGVLGELPDISTIPTEFYLKDANGLALGFLRSMGVSGDQTIYNLELAPSLCGGLLVDTALNQVLGLGEEDDPNSAYDVGYALYKVYYTTDDCTGPAFLSGYINFCDKLFVIEDPDPEINTDNVVAFATQENVSTIMRSERKPGAAPLGGYVPPGACSVIEGEQVRSGNLMQRWIPPEELINPVFPLTLQPAS